MVRCESLGTSVKSLDLLLLGLRLRHERNITLHAHQRSDEEEKRLLESEPWNDIEDGILDGPDAVIDTPEIHHAEIERRDGRDPDDEALVKPEVFGPHHPLEAEYGSHPDDGGTEIEHVLVHDPYTKGSQCSEDEEDWDS